MNVSGFAFNITKEINQIQSREKIDNVETWAEIGLIVYMVLTAVLAISGNGVILLVEIKNLCKTSTDWLVLFMAANDVIFAVISIPILVIFHSGCWQYIGSDVGCMVHIFVEKTTIFSSTLLLCTVAVDRYFKTCRPHFRFLTPEHAFRACVVIMIVSIFVSSPTFPAIKYNNKLFCETTENQGIMVVRIIHIFLIMSFVAMFVVVSVCYARVVYTIKHRLIRNQSSSKLEQQGAVSSSSSAQQRTVMSGWRKKLFSRNKVSPDETIPSEPKRTSVAAPDKGSTEVHKSSISELTGSSSGKDKNVINSIFITVRNKIITGTNTNQNPKTSRFYLREKCAANARTNKTTKIMFAVTLVFLFSWIPTWIIYVYNNLTGSQKTKLGKTIILFGENLFMVNTFMNPIFYIVMSSVFKQRTKKVIRSLLRCKTIRK